MDKSQLLQRIEAGEFFENNGKVFDTINTLKEKYVRLSIIRYAHCLISEGDIRKSINFLEEEGYIHIRDCETKEKVSISDCRLEDAEAKLSGKGIRFACGKIEDDCIKR